ncbi:MAG: phytanoyl-CoA dioxygenase family protein [Casimicrobium sp.]
MNWFAKFFGHNTSEQISQPTALTAESTPNASPSPYGGLWTDRPDAAAQIATLNGATTEEQQRLLYWIERGFVVIPNVLSLSQCDTVVADVAVAVERGSRQMAYWKEGVKHIHAAHPSHLMEFECKVLDVHATIASARDAIFAPKLARFLELIFDAKATAFQTLYLERGSEQGVHQDTAFVYVDPPLDFAATWIALEDIQEGSGELEYYPGSHRLPHTLFGEKQTKAFEPSDPIAGRYADYLHEKCAAAGLTLERFRPKKGDALVWAADLVHGGAPRTVLTTRRSLVTHYCPIYRKPPYANAGLQTTIHGSGHFWLSQT